MKKRCESTAFSLGSRRNGDPIRGAPAGACCVCVFPQIIRVDVLLIRNFYPHGGAARTGDAVSDSYSVLFAVYAL